MRLEQIYQEVILDHYKHPQHRRLREPFSAQVYHINPICGDKVCGLRCPTTVNA